MLKQSLKSNQPVQGNLVEIWDPEVFDELKTLWSCFDPRKPLTAVLCGAAKNVEGATFSSFAFTREEFGQKIEHVALISVGEGSGPWLPKARKVEMTIRCHKFNERQCA